jgi:hypothetical protein
MEGQESCPTAAQPRPKPPGYIKLPGRPKTEKKREDWEAPKGTKLSRAGVMITCSNSQRKGHNRGSCTNNPVAKHHGNAHVVKARTKKVKEQKKATEAESSNRAKVSLDCLFLLLSCIYYMHLVFTSYKQVRKKKQGRGRAKVLLPRKIQLQGH